MAGKKENQRVPCGCLKCGGKLTDPVVYLQHNRKVQSSLSWMAEDLLILRKLWEKGQRLKQFDLI